MIDEGVIKFNCEWNNKRHGITVPKNLMDWRDKMYNLKLIGIYSNLNIAYGNISIKIDQGILISGTQTGSIPKIQSNDFSLVTNYSMIENKVHCTGLIKASAESLTHAAVYEADENIKAIIHIHNKKLWNYLINHLPTSDKSVPYGTSKMASEIKRLFRETLIAQERIMVMGGHDEGIITFGKNLEEAGQVILKYLN